MRARVAIVPCSSYSPKELDSSLRSILDQLGGLKRLVKLGDKVLLKANINNASKPEQASNTHPAFVQAMIRQVLELGAQPLVGDSPGGLHERTEVVYRESGMSAAVREAGGIMVNFDRAGTETISYPTGRILKRFHVSKAILEADVVISLPKLKTHAKTLYTGAIKNLLGALVGRSKKELHRIAPRLEDFGQGLVDIYSFIRPVLTVMDGIVGMEGNGPAQGGPRKIGLILASEDGAALDIIASEILGYHYSDICSNRAAIERGLTVGSIEEIELLGGEIKEVRVKGMKYPTTLAHNKQRIASQVLSSFPPLRRLIDPQVRVKREACKNCGLCVESCPADAMVMTDSAPLIDQKSCIKCFCCYELCPQGAIIIKEPPLAKLLYG